MAEIDPLKQMTDFSVSKGSNFKFPTSQKTGGTSTTSQSLTGDERSGVLNDGYTEYDESAVGLDDSLDAGLGGDVGSGVPGSTGGVGVTGVIKLPSDFSVTFSSEIVVDDTGAQSGVLNVTCSAVPGATDFEVRLVKIA